MSAYEIITLILGAIAICAAYKNTKNNRPSHPRIAVIFDPKIVTGQSYYFIKSATDVEIKDEEN